MHRLEENSTIFMIFVYYYLDGEIRIIAMRQCYIISRKKEILRNKLISYLTFTQ